MPTLAFFCLFDALDNYMIHRFVFVTTKPVLIILRIIDLYFDTVDSEGIIFCGY